MEEINLKELFNYFLSKMWIVIITLFIALSSMFVYTNYMQVPLYKSYTTIVLTTTQNDSTITQNDININQKLVSTYREIIKSRRVLEQVVRNLNLDDSWQSIQNSITVSTESNTEIIRISVSNADSVKAYQIANEIAQVFSKEIVEIYSIDNVSVIDYAIESSSPYNINFTKQMLLASLAGIVLGAGIIFVIFYFDTTIKSSEDIENKLGLIVLGNVPKTKTSISKKTDANIEIKTNIVKKEEPKTEVKNTSKKNTTKKTTTKKTTTTKETTKKGGNK